MILLRLISWPYARKHLLRSLLTTAGIVLGVAVFVGMHTANQSVLEAFHQTIDRIAGSTQLQVTAGDPGFDEDILDRVRDTPGVAAAAPVIEARVSISQGNLLGNLLILGVDMLGDRNLRSYDFDESDQQIDDPLVFLAQPDSLIVTKTFADEGGLKIGSQIPMKTMQGDQVFTVRGLMKPGGLASAFGGNLAIMDIYAAQKVFGRGRRFDRIDVALAEGVGLDAGAARILAAVGPGFQVQPPSSRGQQFEATSQIFALASSITSLFALFIGMFIIYNTFAIAVTERRSEIGILRALGATQRQIRTLFLSESAMAGLIGTLAGILFGILMARGMAGYIGGLMAEIYGMAQTPGELTLSPVLLGGALAMGVATSLIAGFIPARAAAGVDPVKALQKGRAQSLSEGESRKRRLWGAAAVVLALIAFAFSSSRVMFYIGYVLVVIAAILFAPALSSWLARAIRPALAWLRPVEGALAADSLIQAPRRTAGTIAALMLSLALVISLAGLTGSSYNSLYEWMRITFTPDLFVTAGESLTSQAFAFPSSLGGELRKIEGIEEVQMVRFPRVLVKGVPVMLVATDVAAIGRRARLPAVDGDSQTMYQKTAAGEGVMVSENFSRLHRARAGDILDIPTPTGILKLPIVGIVRDYSDQQGSILIARHTYVQNWHDDSINIFRIFLKKGADEARVTRTIREKLGAHQRLFVLTNREVRDFVIRVTDQFFGLTYVQIAVAVLVAILGIVNTLTVSITDRRRELGVLQAVGGLRNQVRRTVWMEALAISFIGLTLGLALGAVQLYYSIVVASRDLVGISFDYVYPVRTALALIPIMLGAAFLAALAPAESAVRGSLVEALEYE